MFFAARANWINERKTIDPAFAELWRRLYEATQAANDLNKQIDEYVKVNFKYEE